MSSNQVIQHLEMILNKNPILKVFITVLFISGKSLGAPDTYLTIGLWLNKAQHSHMMDRVLRTHSNYELLSRFTLK